MFLTFVILIAVFAALVSYLNNVTAKNAAKQSAHIPKRKPSKPQAVKTTPPEHKITVTTSVTRRQPTALKLELDGEPVVITINEGARAACEEAARKTEHSLGDIAVLRQGFDVDVDYKGESYRMNGTRGMWHSYFGEYEPEQEVLASLVLNAIGYDAEKWEIRPAKENFKSPEGLQRIDISIPNELNGAINNQASKHIKDNYYLFKLASEQEFAVGISLDNPWLDVMARGRKKGEKDGLYTGPYNRHGFHAEESRWSYGDGPPGATEIRKLLHEHFGTPAKRGRFV